MAKRWVRNQGGVRLSEILKGSGEEQQALETRLGLKPGYVSDAIKGKARPSYAKRMRFHAELKIPLDLWDVNIVTKEGAVS
jgi:transcriptional regulator with XRE-family HTH domain